MSDFGKEPWASPAVPCRLRYGSLCDHECTGGMKNVQYTPVLPIYTSVGAETCGLSSSSSSKSILSSSPSHSMIGGHSEFSVALILPVSNSINSNEVSFRPTNTLVSSPLTEVNGEMSTSSDMVNGKRWSGVEGECRTYIAPDCGSMMYVSCCSSASKCPGGCDVRTRGAKVDGAETLVVVKKDDIDHSSYPDVRLIA